MSISFIFPIRYDDYIPGESKITDRPVTKCIVVYDLDFSPARVLLSDFALDNVLSSEWIQNMTINPDTFYSRFILLFTNESADDLPASATPDKKLVRSKELAGITPIVSISPRRVDNVSEGMKNHHSPQHQGSPLNLDNRQQPLKVTTNSEATTPIRTPKTQRKAQIVSNTVHKSPSPLRRSAPGEIQKEYQHQIPLSISAILPRKRRATVASSDSEDDTLFQLPSPVSEPDW